MLTTLCKKDHCLVHGPRVALHTALLVAGLTCIHPSAATTLLYEDFASLVKKSDGVVVGSVAAVDPIIGDDNRIYTLVTLETTDVPKGQLSGKTLTLRLLGGEVDGQALEVEGSPRFEQGEEVVVFIQGNGQQIVPFVGWGQGVFRVKRDVQTGKTSITDTVGNRVFGISKNQVVKEARYKADVEIVGESGTTADAGEQARIHSQSSDSETSAGVSDTVDSASEQRHAAQTATEGSATTAMDLPKFVKAIRSRVASQRQISTESQTLINAQTFGPAGTEDGADVMDPTAAQATRAPQTKGQLTLPKAAPRLEESTQD